MITSLQHSIWSMALLVFICTSTVTAQEKRPFLEPADTFDNKRFWISAATGTAIYTGFSIGLWEAWYKDHPIGSFRFFNDMGEWQDLDKTGHLFSAYIQSNSSFYGALWTGMERRDAMWTAAGIGILLQGTFEVMDGFSEKWGFSIPDFIFNTAGSGLFVAQELAWQEQRIIMKVSSSPPNYSEEPIFSVDGAYQTSLAQRVQELYGENYFERFIKDYNGQTTWASFNIHAFLPPSKSNSKLPKWLNVAVGYGGSNMYGGFRNTWENEEGAIFMADPVRDQRYKQFYLSLDVDLSRIKTNSRVVKLLLGAVNWIKIPSPSLEYNTLGALKFHPIYW